VNNRIPEFNSLVSGKNWRQALDILHDCINFPEITGRVCPALCEPACTLAIDMPAVSIKHIELQIVERGFQNGWIIPQVPFEKTGKRVAIIGSGPAGLSAAQQLARKGHEVIVFEKDDRIGAYLRYGIPDCKLEKYVIDRRLRQMEAEGVQFETSVSVGEDISSGYLMRSFDATIITAGAREARDLDVPGRDLDGISFAVDFLKQQNKENAGDVIPAGEKISAKGKNVLVIGGGDTGSDCIGTSRRQGAKNIYQVEILPEPPTERADDNPWPEWPRVKRVSSSQEEGCERYFSVATKEFKSSKGKVTSAKLVKVEWTRENGRFVMNEVPGSEFELKVDLVVLAMGFVHIEQKPLVDNFGIEVDERGNVKVDDDLMTTVPGVFAAGDSVLGASLVVRVFEQGRRVAENVDAYLVRESAEVQAVT